jgi:predicted enzyme related to lactoylglutathione lyase
MNGQVVHFEIPADDVERARGFYREAFGWQLAPVPDMDYTMVTTTPSGPEGMPTEPGAINGGMLARQGPIKGPVITVDVDDMDAALKKVQQLGAKTVTGRQAVGDMGFSAYFEDTEGNVIGLWQNANRVR